MKALPTVSAMGIIHIGTMAGKLKGVMPATTPSGSRRNSQVTPRLTSSEAPASRFCRDRAKSHTSSPLSSPARASATVLPASLAARWASRSSCDSSSERKRDMITVRSRTGMARQPGTAPFAASTAWATPEAGVRGTRPMTPPV